LNINILEVQPLQGCDSNFAYFPPVPPVVIQILSLWDNLSTFRSGLIIAKPERNNKISFAEECDFFIEHYHTTSKKYGNTIIEKAENLYWARRNKVLGLVSLISLLSPQDFY
jgi:hypothetical protein